MTERDTLSDTLRTLNNAAHATMQAELDAANAKLAVTKSALAWYAHQAARTDKLIHGEDAGSMALGIDGGLLACRALAKIERMK